MKICDFRRTPGHARGFTLVELMVTVAILVILLAIGVPAMQGFLASRQVAGKTDALASAIRFARSEALKRAQSVTICQTTTADSVTPTCDTGTGDWNSGWLVFVDNAPADGSYDKDKELLVKVQQALPGGGVFKADDGKPMRTIKFTADGLAIGSNTGFYAFSDAGCTKLTLAPSGRVSTEKMKTAACEKESS